MINSSILGLVGNTPLVKLNSLDLPQGVEICAKLEMFNPGGSVKDRPALYMIEEAEKRGLLKRGMNVVENSSGNFGIALAMVCAVKGYKCTIVTTDITSDEKVRMLVYLGAEVVITSASLKPQQPGSSQSVVREMMKDSEVFSPDQYSNPNNPMAHYLTTGPEILAQTGSTLTHFICSIGTGGTISGTARFLKERNQATRVIGVEPQGSIYQNYLNNRRIQSGTQFVTDGIGSLHQIPENVQFEFIDDIVQVSDSEALSMAKKLAREEGIPAGWSSGSTVCGALNYCNEIKGSATVVVILPDGAGRYLSKFLNWKSLEEAGILQTHPRVSDLLAAKAPIRGLVTTVRTTTLGMALERMVRNGISHLPVTRGGTIIGRVDKSALISEILRDPLASRMPLDYYMQEPYSEISLDAPLAEFLQLIAKVEAIIVKSEGKPVGILTKSDLGLYESAI